MARRGFLVASAGLLILLASLFPNAALARTLHVRAGGGDAEDGLQWATAKATVRAALDAAGSGDQVWVAAGTYPECLTLKEGVSLYGGFLGTETSLDQRDWKANLTILEGGKRGSVVTAPSGVTASTLLDGFTVRGGLAARGGGILCLSSSPTILHCTLTGNVATDKGGGLYASQGSTPVVRLNRIEGNTARAGGGIYLEGRAPLTLSEAPRADYPYVGVGESVGLSVTATGEEGETLQYQWTARDGGTLTGQGRQVSFSDTTAGVRHIDVTVTDPLGHSVGGTAVVTVLAVTLKTPLPTLTTGQPSGLQAVVTPAVASTPEYPVKLTWSVSEGPAAGAFDAAVNGTEGATTLDFTPSASGPGTVKVELSVGSATTSDQAAFELNPRPASLSPDWGQQGLTSGAVLAGANLDRVTGVMVSGAGVVATLQPPVTSDRLPLSFEVPGTAETTQRTLTLLTPEGSFESDLTWQVKGPTLWAEPETLDLRVGTPKTFRVHAPRTAPAGGLALSLSSSAPGIATVPASVNLPAGESSVEVTVAPIAPGEAVLSATTAGLGGATLRARVLAAPALSFSPSPLETKVGRVEMLILTSSVAAPQGGLAVALSTGGAVAELPAQAMIASGSTSVVVPVKGIGAGSTVVHASAEGYPSADLTLTVSSGVMALFPGRVTVGAGKSVALTVALPSKAPEGGTSVALISGDQGIASVPTSVVVPAGQQSASIPVKGESAGEATITASAPGQATAQATVRVLESYWISFHPAQLSLLPNRTASVDLLLSEPAPEGGQTVSLTPAAGGFSVPATVFVPAGRFSAPVEVRGLEPTGSPVSVAASSPGMTDGKLNVTVERRFELKLSAEVVVGAGCVATGIVTLDRPPRTDLTITLAPADPSILSVPTTVTIPGDRNGQTFSIHGRHPGVGAILASVDGISSASSIATVVKPVLSLQGPDEMSVGTTAVVTLRTSVPGGSSYTCQWSWVNQPPLDFLAMEPVRIPLVEQTLWKSASVALTSTDPAALQCPGPIAIPVDRSTASCQISAVGVGSATLGAQAPGWVPAAKLVTTGGARLRAGIVVGVGCVSYGTLSLMGGASAKDLTVALESNNKGIATVPATLKIPAGTRHVRLPITGVSVGNCTIHASAPGFNEFSTVTVVPATLSATVDTKLDLGQSGNLTVGLAVAGGTAYQLPYSEDGLAIKAGMTWQTSARALQVSLSATNPSVLQVPKTVNLAPDQGLQSVQMVGLSSGASQVRVSAQGFSDFLTPHVVVGGLWFRPGVTVGVGCLSSGAVGLSQGVAPAGGVKVLLSSSRPEVATFPPSVTIPAGTSAVTFPITGVQAGTAELRAFISGLTLTGNVLVVTPVIIPTHPSTMVPGAKTSLTLELFVQSGSYITLVTQQPSYPDYTAVAAKLVEESNQTLVSPLEVGLETQNPAVLRVTPSKIVFPASSPSGSATLEAMSEGKSNIILRPAGRAVQSGGTVTVERARGVLALYASVKVGIGCRSIGALSVSPDLTADADLVVSLSCRVSGAVPSTVTIPRGSTSAAFPMTPSKPTSFQVTASAKGAAAYPSAWVSPALPDVGLEITGGGPGGPVSGQTLTYSVKTTVAGGTTYEGMVPPPAGSLDNFSPKSFTQQPHLKDLEVTLSSSNGRVLELPDKVVIPAGSALPVQGQVLARSSGTTTLKAAAPDCAYFMPTLTVGGLWLRADVTVGVGCRTVGGLGFADLWTGQDQVVVTLTSSNPDVARVPSTVTVPRGDGAAVFDIIGHTPGKATIRATMEGSSAVSETTVVTASLGFGETPREIPLAASVQVPLKTMVTGGTLYTYPLDWARQSRYGLDVGNVQAQTDLPIAPEVSYSIVAEDGSVLKVTPGLNGANVQGVMAGTSRLLLTSTAWPAVASSPIAVVGPVLHADVTVGAGCTTTGAVGAPGAYAPSGGYRVLLRSDDPSIASVPAEVTIEKGIDGASFPIVGGRPGSVMVQATVAGVTSSARVTVVQPTFTVEVPTVVNTLSYGFAKVSVVIPGGSRAWWWNGTDGSYAWPGSVIELPSSFQHPLQPLVASLSASDPSLVTLPPSVTVPVSAYEPLVVTFATSKGIGPFTVTATAPGWRAATSAPCVVRPAGVVGLQSWWTSERGSLKVALAVDDSFPYIGGMTFTLTYDPKVLSLPADLAQLAARVIGVRWPNDLTVQAKMVAPGTIRVAMLEGMRYPSEGFGNPLAYVSLDVLPGASGSTYVGLAVEDIVSSNGVPFRPSRSQGATFSLSGLAPLSILRQTLRPELGQEDHVTAAPAWTRPLTTRAGQGAGTGRRPQATLEGVSSAYPGSMRPSAAPPHAAQASSRRLSRAGQTRSGGGRWGLLYASLLGQAAGEPVLALLEGNLILGNTAEVGGGVALHSAPAVVRDNLIVGNSSVNGIGGGGVYVEGYTAATTLARNTVALNVSGSGKGGGVYAAAPLAPMPSSLFRQNGDDLWGCTATYSGVTNLAEDPGTGNISADPGFVQTTDPDADGFYRLAAGSPCVNAGDPATLAQPGETDIDGAERIAGSLVDMGADELADAAEPQTTILSGPRGGAAVPATTVAFTWMGSDDVTPRERLTYAYRLDGGAWTAYGPTTAATFGPLAEGAHVLAVKSQDLAGRETSPPVTAEFVVDLGAVAISAPEITPGATQAMVSWTTSRTCTSWLTYRDAAGSAAQTAQSVTAGTQHGVTLGGLTPGHTYLILLHATDATGHEWTSNEVSFQTNGPPIAKAGPDLSLPQDSASGASARLDASASSDPDGDALSYRWREGTTLLAGPSGAATASVMLSVGTHHLVLEVEDPFKNQSSDELLVTVTADQAPTATPGRAATTPGVPVAVKLSGSDADAAAVLTYQLVAQPSHGQLSGTAPDLTYAPNPGYLGADLLRFTVSDGVLTSEPADVRITVAEANQPPTALNQALTVEAGSALPIDLKGTDPEGATLTFALSSAPRHGTLSALEHGALTYTADADYSGTDSFDFTANDGLTDSEPGRVSLTVTPASLVGRLVVARASALPGRTVDVPVSAEGLGELTSASLCLDLRPPGEVSPLDLAVLAGSWALGGSVSCGPLSEDARMDVVVHTGEASEGDLVLLRAAVPSSAPPGTVYQLGLASARMVLAKPDGSTEQVKPALVGGSITVLAPGDVSGDGRADIADVVMLIRIALGLQPGTSDQRLAGDLNEDGVVSIVDVLIALRRALHVE